MILLDLIYWLCDHWEEVTLNSVLLLLLRKFIMSEVHKLLYFNRDEEMKWMREQLEEVTGKKWSGQQPIWKRAEIRYIKKYSLYSLAVLKQKRRLPKMNLSGKKKILAIGVAILINGCNDVFGLNLTPETITTVSALGGGYVLVEAIIDIVRAWVNRGKPINVKPTIDGSADK